MKTNILLFKNNLRVGVNDWYVSRWIRFTTFILKYNKIENFNSIQIFFIEAIKIS